MPVIIDSSVLLARMLGEARELIAERIIAHAIDRGAAAPALLPFEIVNVLSRNAQEGRVTWAHAHAQLRAYVSIGIEHDAAPSHEVRVQTARLCEAHALTGYDAAFLELAIREGGELATFNGELADAGVANGLTVHRA